MNKDYEKKKATEMLTLIQQYEETDEKKEINEDLYKLSDELYNQNREKLSQEMIDISLSVFYPSTDNCIACSTLNSACT